MLGIPARECGLASGADGYWHALNVVSVVVSLVFVSVLRYPSIHILGSRHPRNLGARSIFAQKKEARETINVRKHSLAEDDGSRKMQPREDRG